MNLAQLIGAVDFAKHERYPERVDVVITTRLPYATVGQRAYTNVASVGMGFDWERNQFRIDPQEELMCVIHNGSQKVLELDGTYFCQKCQRMIGVRRNIDMNYCYHCGQAVKW